MKIQLYKQLGYIQKALKAPKGQYNAFGKYKYRSCEDILEAVKPLLEDMTLTIEDELIHIGDRYYVKAVVTISDGEDCITVTAFAREEETKKGMDASQITGAASSYARKYALHGLLLIDDTKDADTQDNSKKGQPEKPEGQKAPQLRYGPAPEPPSEPEPPDVPEPEQLNVPIPLLYPDHPLHKKIEASISEGKINRDLFKEYLFSLGKLEIPEDGKEPSFKTMSITNAQAMMMKWDNTVEAYQSWRKRVNKEG